MAPPSVFSRLWEAVKPPPAARRPGEQKVPLSGPQKRLLYSTAVVLAIGGAGWGAYAYVSSAPQRAETQYHAAMIVMADGKYEAAVRGFTGAIQTWPQLANAYLERGVCHRYLHQDDRAMADFDQAIAIDSRLARAYTARGFIYRERGDNRHAMEEFSRSIEISPNVDAYFERGQTYEALGEHQKAIGDFDMAISEIRDAPYIYRARAFARRNLGDVAGSEADQKTAESLEKRH